MPYPKHISVWNPALPPNFWRIYLYFIMYLINYNDNNYNYKLQGAERKLGVRTPIGNLHTKLQAMHVLLMHLLESNPPLQPQLICFLLNVILHCPDFRTF